MQSALKNTILSGSKRVSVQARQSSVRRFTTPTSSVLLQRTMVKSCTTYAVCYHSTTPQKNDGETDLRRKGKEDTNYAMGVASETVHNVEEFVFDTAKHAYSSGKEYSKAIKEELKKEYDPNDKEFVHRATEAVTDVAKDVYEATKQVAKKAGDAMYDKATDLAAAGTYKVIQGASTLVSAGKEYAGGAVEAVRETLPGTEDVKEAAKDAFESGKEFTMEASEKIAHGVSVAAHSGSEVAKHAYASGKEFVVGASEVAAKSASDTVAAAQEYANKKIVADGQPDEAEAKKSK